MKRALLVLLVLLATSCQSTDEARTVMTLRSSGYTEIHTTGYVWWGCSDSDWYSTGFHAKNPRGEWVDGVVCCGLSKACTVRF